MIFFYFKIHREIFSESKSILFTTKVVNAETNMSKKKIEPIDAIHVALPEAVLIKER